MPDLSYKITTSAELAGAQATADALDRQIGKAKALKQDYSELSKQRDIVNQSLKDSVAVTDEASDSTFKLSERSREQYRLFGELNRIVPGLGENLRGLSMLGFNPLIAVASMAAYGLYEAKRALDGFNKSLDASGEAAAKSDFIDGIQARIDALNALIDATQDYVDKEAEVLRVEQDIAAALQEQLQLLAAIEAARHQSTQAQKGLAEAKVGLAEQEGKITPAQAIEQKADIERQFNLKEYHDKIAANNDKLGAQQMALAAAQIFQPIFDNLKKVADANAADAKGKFNAAESQLKSPEQNAAKLKSLADALDVAAKELEKQKGIAAEVAWGGSPETIAYQNSQVAAAQASLDAANNAVALQQKVIAQATAGTSPEARAQLRHIEDDAKEADARALKNAQDINKLTTQVTAMQSEMAATGPIAAGTIATQQTTVTTKEETELIKQGRADITKYTKAVEEGNPQQQLKLLEDLFNAIKGHANVTAALQVNVGAVLAQIAELEANQKQLHSRQQHNQLP